MKKSSFYIIFVTVIAAIGGLLFGFDTAIVAGATRYLKDQFALTSIQEGWAVSVVLMGCMFGAGISGTISDRIGRKRFMLVSAVLFLVSAVGCALPGPSRNSSSSGSSAAWASARPPSSPLFISLRSRRPGFGGPSSP